MSLSLNSIADQRRFWSKVDFSQIDGCWPWKGHITRKGYGRFFLNGKVRQAHRVAYQAHYGEFPETLVCDHLCRNHSCCNPSHLEAVTHKENVLRGVSFAAENARKTHCVNGHKYTDDNIYWPSSGGRLCKTCANKRERIRKRLKLGWTEEEAYAD